MESLYTKHSIEIKRIVTGPLKTNCYIITYNKEAILVDPGWKDKKIVEALKGYTLKLIIATHGHFDHILGGEMFTHVDFFIHKQDIEIMGKVPFWGIKFTPPKVTGFVDDEDEILIGKNKLKILHTPGHTRGSISIIGDGFIFTGDTLFYSSIGRTDLEESCPECMEKSLSKILKNINEDFLILPGHEKPASLKEIKSVNPFINL